MHSLLSLSVATGLKLRKHSPSPSTTLSDSLGSFFDVTFLFIEQKED